MNDTLAVLQCFVDREPAPALNLFATLPPGVTLHPHTTTGELRLTYDRASASLGDIVRSLEETGIVVRGVLQHSAVPA